jgi:hypothetical protein
MDIPSYIAVSSVVIMLWHFTMNSNPRTFGILQMVGIFAFGGAIGWYMESMMVGLMFSVAMSLLFIH